MSIHEMVEKQLLIEHETVEELFELLQPDLQGLQHEYLDDLKLELQYEH
jgi:hypothetical protein